VIEVTIPARFWQDHAERGCVQFSGDGYSYTTIKRTARQVTVLLHPLDVADLMSDAVYYSDGRDFDPDLRGLSASARATVVALVKQGIEPDARWAREVARIMARHEMSQRRKAAKQ
jgi:hypothetical protein